LRGSQIHFEIIAGIVHSAGNRGIWIGCQAVKDRIDDLPIYHTMDTGDMSEASNNQATNDWRRIRREPHAL